MIIVTGGAGFVGSNLVKGLNERGIDNILVVDNMANVEKFKNLLGLKFSDYRDKEEFLKDVENNRLGNVEAIFHQGACSDTMEYNGKYMMANNYEYSKKMLHWCLPRKVPFIYASSASVYGSGQHGFREDPVCEGALNVYAFSKLMFDRHVRTILPKADSQVVGLRYFNVYGPQEHHKQKMASVAYHLYNQMKETGKVKLFKGIDGYGDGEQKRDFVYVKDVVKVNLFFYDNPDKKGVFNCGTGMANPFNAIAQAIVKHFGKGEIEYIDFPEVLKGKYQSFTQADHGQLKAVGYDIPFTPIEEAVAEYCRILDQSNGYLV